MPGASQAPVPFTHLAYLYAGSSKFDEDVAYYRDVLRGDVVWNLTGFGARVAAIRLAREGPLWLIADHRPAPSVLPVFAVDDLDAATRALKARGWKAEGERFEVPDGPCFLFRDPSGNELCILGNERPHALERSDR